MKVEFGDMWTTAFTVWGCCHNKLPTATFPRSYVKQLQPPHNVCVSESNPSVCMHYSLAPQLCML